MLTRISKVNGEYQITIAEPVRLLLALKEGDEIAFDIAKNTVQFRGSRAPEPAYAHGLEEWLSEVDELAYQDL
jgi:bifunctional DNA-binding transcriptional regulator/antitoxin component of YhaV-PrlF toxin-antitoxin module